MTEEWQQILEEMKKTVKPKSDDTLNPTSSKIGKTKTCSKCNGRGWYFIDYNTVRECECGLVEKDRQESKLRFASIPETYKDVTLRDMTTKYYFKRESKEIFKASAELIKWYLENLEENIENGKGIYFWSKIKGSGKTMMASALANELINKYKRYVKFATSLDILDEIKATYNDQSEGTEKRLLNDITSADFLIIDDFGTERNTDWATEKFYQIVNKRYVDKKVTFFTSNFDLKTLKYDDRITNRIKERSYVVHFPEESVREVKATQENTFEGGKE